MTRSNIRDNFTNNQIQRVDFSDPESIRSNINAFVEDATHSIIQELLPPGSVLSSSNLVLVNAAYFKAEWDNMFNAASTKNETFYGSTEGIVEMMSITKEFFHGS